MGIADVVVRHSFQDIFVEYLGNPPPLQDGDIRRCAVTLLLCCFEPLDTNIRWADVGACVCPHRMVAPDCLENRH